MGYSGVCGERVELDLCVDATDSKLYMCWWCRMTRGVRGRGGLFCFLLRWAWCEQDDVFVVGMGCSCQCRLVVRTQASHA